MCPVPLSLYLGQPTLRMIETALATQVQAYVASRCVTLAVSSHLSDSVGPGIQLCKKWGEGELSKLVKVKAFSPLKKHPDYSRFFFTIALFIV